jgi:hypothetical protein
MIAPVVGGVRRQSSVRDGGGSVRGPKKKRRRSKAVAFLSTDPGPYCALSSAGASGGAPTPL